MTIQSRPAITYQIIPADTQHAEIPLAAFCSTYQHKGLGRLLYMELRKRLQDVGIGTILCWGDKESEGFWQKQVNVGLGEVVEKSRTIFVASEEALVAVKSGIRTFSSDWFMNRIMKQEPFEIYNDLLYTLLSHSL